MRPLNRPLWPKPLPTFALLALALAAPVHAAKGTPAPPPARSAAPDPRNLAAAARDNALRHYLQGVYLEGTGDGPGAIQEIGRAFAADPNAPDLAVKLSELALKVDDPATSLQYARRAIALGEKTGRAHFLAGAALAGAGNPKQARAEFESAVRADSSNAESWQALGRIQDELGDLGAARAAFERARSIDPDDSEVAYRLATLEARAERWSAADSLLAQVEDANPYQPGLSAMRAFVAERLGRTAEAARDYETHLRTFPNDQQTRRRLVQAYVRLEDWPAATREARRLFDEAPDDYDAGRVLTSLYLTQKQNDQAVAVVKQLRQRLPGEVEPAAFATAVLLHVGQETEARAEADALTRERPRDSRAWIVAAEAWAAKDTPDHLSPDADRRYAQAEAVLADSTGARVELARSFTRSKRFARAEKTLEGAIAAEPRNSRLWLELAFARERRKDVPGSEAAARRCLELDPKSGQALNFLGYLYADYSVKVDQAVPLIERALALDPDNPYYIDSLGWAYFRLGRLEDARGQLERAVALGGGEAEVFEHLGDVYLALARRGDAKSQYQKALQLEPTKTSLARKLEALR